MRPDSKIAKEIVDKMEIGKWYDVTGVYEMRSNKDEKEKRKMTSCPYCKHGLPKELIHELIETVTREKIRKRIEELKSEQGKRVNTYPYYVENLERIEELEDLLKE